MVESFWEYNLELSNRQSANGGIVPDNIFYFLHYLDKLICIELNTSIFIVYHCVVCYFNTRFSPNR